MTCRFSYESGSWPLHSLLATIRENDLVSAVPKAPLCNGSLSKSFWLLTKRLLLHDVVLYDTIFAKLEYVEQLYA